jgi:hypothetical protein
MPIAIQGLRQEPRDILDQHLMHGVTVRAGRIRADVAREKAHDERTGVDEDEVSSIGDANHFGGRRE